MRLPARVRSLGASLLSRASMRVRAGPNRGLRWSVASSGRGCLSGTFEAERLARMVRLAPPGGFAWDVGAHKGYVTLALARAVGREGQVVAVEPAPENLIALQRHLEWNGIRNARVVAAAVGATDGRMRFGGEGASISYHLGGGDTEVAVTTLAGLFVRGESRVPDLIKLDVEGEEARALASAGAALGAPTAVCVAVHSPQLYSECAAILRARGFRVLCSRAIHAWKQDGRWRGDPDVVAFGPAHPRRHDDAGELGLHEDQ